MFHLGTAPFRFEPLSIQSLTTLRQHSPNDADDDADSVVKVLCYLGSLLSNVTSSDHTLPIVPHHTSLHDFMTNEEKSSIFYVDLHIAHQQLAHSCLDLMLTELKFNICGLESSYLENKDVEGLEMCIAQHLPPALSYACHLWGDHLKQLDFDTNIFGKLQTLFGMKFLFWLTRWPTDCLRLFGWNNLCVECYNWRGGRPIYWTHRFNNFCGLFTRWPEDCLRFN